MDDSDDEALWDGFDMADEESLRVLEAQGSDFSLRHTAEESLTTHEDSEPIVNTQDSLSPSPIDVFSSSPALHDQLLDNPIIRRLPSHLDARTQLKKCCYPIAIEGGQPDGNNMDIADYSSTIGGAKWARLLSSASGIAAGLSTLDTTSDSTGRDAGVIRDSDQSGGGRTNVKRSGGSSTAVKRHPGRPRKVWTAEEITERDAKVRAKKASTRPVGRPRKPKPIFGSAKNELLTIRTNPSLHSNVVSGNHGILHEESVRSSVIVSPSDGPLSASEGTMNPGLQCRLDISNSPSPLVSITTPQMSPFLVHPTQPLDVGTSDQDDDDLGQPEFTGDGEGAEEEWDDGDAVEPDGTRCDVDVPPLLYDLDCDNPTSTRQTRNTTPGYVLELFKQHRAKYAKRNNNDQTILYHDFQTFWIPQPSGFFSLRVISPEKLYNPRFFLWDPFSLVKDGINCPVCKVRLHRHGDIMQPRRVVGLSTCYWLMGTRYRCPECVNEKSRKRTRTFNSWDPRILATLPPDLAAEFPAHLTHRSGIDKEVFALMQTCFYNGLGAKQFSDTLHVRHLEHFDSLQVQYLEMVKSASNMSKFLDYKFNSFGTFEGEYGGFVPSAHWLRNAYDDALEGIAAELDQYMSMLTADICAIDHSHVVAKRIAKILGSPLFTAAITLTNKYGELQMMNFTPTKAHEAFRSALEGLRDSLTQFGHSQPQVIYTDNTSDAPFLQGIFPSLTEDIHPQDLYAHLPLLCIPHPEVTTVIAQTSKEIDSIMSALMFDGLEGGRLSKDFRMVVGFDCEWNVDLTGPRGSQVAGKMAVVQIAHDKQIYILQISSFIHAKKLPPLLEAFLLSPQIIKAGRCVAADLKRIQRDIGSKHSYSGGQELAHMAKARGLISNLRVSLSDLCAIILQFRLDKNPSIRTSTAWEDRNLPETHIEYAALDAWASLRLYMAMSEVAIPGELPTNSAFGTPIALWHEDRSRIIAYGILGHRDQKSYDGINITKTRTLVTITEVLLGSALITLHEKRSLSSLGSAPFSIVCQWKHLQARKPSSESDTSKSPPVVSVFCRPVSSVSSGLIGNVDASSDEPSSLSKDPVPLETCQTALQAANEPADGLEDNPDSAEVDSASAAEGANVLDAPTFSSGLALEEIISRVLKDAWHLMDMPKVPANHGLRRPYFRAFRDAMFIPDRDDRARIEEYAKKHNTTFEKLVLFRPKWLNARCKRLIPRPAILLPLVTAVMRTYGPLKDATNGQPLFNHNAWKAVRGVLKTIQDGFVSDPPGIALYYQIGVDSKADNLPIYRCCRGTNFTEGGIHRPILSSFPSTGVGPRHAAMRLKAFAAVHNLRVGTRNRTGKTYKGHFNIPLLNRLQELQNQTQAVIVHPELMKGWVNGRLYLQTREKFGILPIPMHMQQAAEIKPFDELAVMKTRYLFLARQQGTLFAVTGICQDDEKRLFGELKKKENVFRGNDFVVGAIILCVMQLAEHLKAYNGTWTSNANERASLLASADMRAELETKLGDPAHTRTSKPVLQFTARALQLTDSAVPTDRTLTSRSSALSINSTAAVETTLTQDSSTPASHPTPAIISNSSTHIISTIHSPVNHAPGESSGSTSKAAASERKPRKNRQCCRCGKFSPKVAGLSGCPGSAGLQKCRNPCRDCGHRDCLVG